MTRIAQEEIEHFGMVVERIKARGYELGPERKDDYVGELLQFIKRKCSREEQLVDRLLFAAMIEARSCERFQHACPNGSKTSLIGGILPGADDF